MATYYTDLKKTENKNGEIEFQAEIPAAMIERGVEAALRDIAGDFSLPGFRKGKVPEAMVREHLGEMELLETAADDLLREAVREIANDEKLSVIGKPQLTITKIAPKNPLGFRVRFALTPDVSLPDYKKIGKKIAATETPALVAEAEMKEAEERVKQMMGGIELTEEMKKQLKTQLEEEKKLGMKESLRDRMIKEIVHESKVKLPPMLVEQEADAFAHDRTESLKNANLSMEDYLKQIGKTQEAFDKEERALVEEQIRTTLVLQNLRKRENLLPDEKEVRMNIARLKTRYPEQSEDALRPTAEAINIQKKLFDVLEGKEAKAD